MATGKIILWLALYEVKFSLHRLKIKGGFLACLKNF
jgi:hypothetical protein